MNINELIRDFVKGGVTEFDDLTLEEQSDLLKFMVTDDIANNSVFEVLAEMLNSAHPSVLNDLMSNLVCTLYPDKSYNWVPSYGLFMSRYIDEINEKFDEAKIFLISTNNEGIKVRTNMTTDDFDYYKSTMSYISKKLGVDNE